MELSEMFAIKPADYLMNGFYDDTNEFRQDLNGLYSLAMAYRCREEGLEPEKVDSIVNSLAGIAEKGIESVVENPEQAVDTDSLEKLKQLRNDQEVSGSAVLSELFDAAQPWISNWRDYAALVVHLERITAQLALLKSLPQGNV
jgi:hypothetical protein